MYAGGHGCRRLPFSRRLSTTCLPPRCAQYISRRAAGPIPRSSAALFRILPPVSPVCPRYCFSASSSLQVLCKRISTPFPTLQQPAYEAAGGKRPGRVTLLPACLAVWHPRGLVPREPQACRENAISAGMPVSSRPNGQSRHHPALNLVQCRLSVMTPGCRSRTTDLGPRRADGRS